MIMTIRKNATGIRASTISQYDSAGAFGNSDVISPGPATLLAIIVSSKGAGALWLLLYDAGTVPTNGAAPVTIPIAVAAGSTTSISFVDVSGFGLSGMDFASGICWAASTTPGTLTADTTNAISVTARFAA
jgi:hypothetical protein